MSLKDALDLISEDAEQNPFKIDDKGYTNAYYTGLQILSYYKQKIIMKIHKVKKWIRKKQYK